ncbi:MAG: omptin family outer membrane protease [Syntrophales bacterium]
MCLSRGFYYIFVLPSGIDWCIQTDDNDRPIGGTGAGGSTGKNVMQKGAQNMTVRMSGGVTLLFFLLVALPVAAAAQPEPAVRITDRISLGLRVERLVASHTSYEFGNPYPPKQVPLSRLEFPLDSWWAGAELRANFPRFSVGLEALTNLSREVEGRMHDSDWDDEDEPDRKTIFSESRSRLEPSYMLKADIDLKTSDWLGLPDWIDLRPVAGVRRQRFSFVTHDGTQWDLTGQEPPTPLPGDGIAFEQVYTHYFLGLKASLDLPKPDGLESITALVQLDWAYVEGRNRDHHVLRAGERYTFEDTNGHAWHGSIGLRLGLTGRLSLSAVADFLAIETRGDHRLVNAPLDMEYAFPDGVKAWSGQNRYSLLLQYRF